MDPAKSAPGRLPVALIGLGACLPLGWSILDLWMFLCGSETLEFLLFVPSILCAVLLGALAGAMARSWLLMGGMLLGTGAVVGFTQMKADSLSLSELWLPMAIGFMLLNLALGRFLLQKFGFSWARFGLCLGCLAGAVFTDMHGTPRSVLYPPAIISALILISVLIPKPRWRLGATLALIITLVLISGFRLHRMHDLINEAPGTQLTAPAGTPNLLLITLDTVGAQHMETYGYERKTMPSLDRFAQDEATIYTRARSTSPFTLASHGSIFTGLFPSEHGATRPYLEARPMRTDVATLPERLQRGGYQTAGIIANVGYLVPRFGFDRGFEHFDYRRGGILNEHRTLAQLAGKQLFAGHAKGRTATKITGAAIDWLAEERDHRPFFLMLNYMDAHEPYQPPAPFNLAFDERQPIDDLNTPTEIHSLLYDRELLYLDSQLERLFAALKEQELFDNTAIIVTSDHGEALGGHGLKDHCWNLYDDVVHVPLIVKPAGGRVIERITDVFNGAQVFDLCFELTGLQADELSRDPRMMAEWHPWKTLSTEILEWAERTEVDPTRSLLAWYEDGVKYIVSSLGEVEAYHMEQDPNELNPLPLSAERKAEVYQWAVDWWGEHQAPETGEEGMNDDAADLLRALGYGG